MRRRESTYNAYLLRCWQEKRDEKLIWRFSLEPVHGERPIGFADLGALHAYLRQLTSDADQIQQDNQQEKKHERES